MEGISNFSTDGYQYTMIYAYFYNGMKDKISTNEFFFRKNPFNLNYSILGGTHFILKAIKELDFTLEDISYIKKIWNLKDNDPFNNYLLTYDSSMIEIDFIEEGSLVLPHEPLFVIKGPIIWNTILEDRIMNLLNFPTLISTNAFRIKHLIMNKTLLELGFRRGIGPNGSNIGSLYSYIGGADGSSNMNIVKQYDLYFDGSMSHAFILSFTYIKNLLEIKNFNSNENLNYIIDEVLKLKEKLGYNTNIGELASFILFYTTFKNKLYVLIDTYDIFESGLKNFILLAYVAEKLGCNEMVLRIDVDNLYVLTKQIREELKKFDNQNNSNISKLTKLFITNKIDIDKINEIESKNDNQVDIYGMGTKLITCFEQPFLGIVGKQICLDGINSLKLDKNKLMLPFRKDCYRVFLEDNQLISIITLKGEKLQDIVSFYLLNDEKEYNLKIKNSEKLNNSKMEKNIHKIKEKITNLHDKYKNIIDNNLEIKKYFSKNYMSEYKKILNK